MKIYKPEGSLLNTEENLSYIQSAEGLRRAKETGRILEGRAVLCDNEHNLMVDLGGIRGIIPRTEAAMGIAEGTTKDIAIISRTGKPVCFQVMEVWEDSLGGVRPILSRRAAQQECYQNYLQNLLPGEVIPCRITHLESFGCFVDVGCGNVSLIPIDAISVSRISHPSDRFRTGQNIYAAVRGIDALGRVTLTHKELLGSWEENAAKFQSGETVAGIIRSVEHYGVFIELTPNLAGLAEPCPTAFPGQHCSVYIKSLIPEKMKVKLMIVDSFEPTSGPASAPEYFIDHGRIRHWRYSPEGCTKIIESVFY